MQGGTELIAPLWQVSLLEALNRMAVFKDETKRKVNIQVKVLGIDVPSFGASFETAVTARYEIIDRASGSTIYTQEFSSTGLVPASYAFMGMMRARESGNRAVQNNIAMFLQTLETVDFEKAMFPSKQK